ncbi:hypothetical protein HY642_06225 [Candidatus Woesearchaeota archaeon]|nr:hypothetical protein [Candidatus Woesearchaeota archaeon]
MATTLYWASYPFVKPEYVNDKFPENWKYLMLYDEEEYDGFKSAVWASKVDWDQLPFRKYSTLDDIAKLPLIPGATPAFKLHDNGLHREARIELLLLGKPQRISGVKVRKLGPEDFAKQHLAGSHGLLETPKNKRLLAKALERIAGTEVIAYRTYRQWPATWDSIEFWTIGEYYAKQESIRERIRTRKN